MKHSLPSGYVVRSAMLDDGPQTVEMLNAWNMDLMGVADFKVDDFCREWATPKFVMDRDTRVAISPEGKVVAYWEIWDVEEPHVRAMSWGAVHPKHAGCEIGDYLLAWGEKRSGLAVQMAPSDARVVLHAYVRKIDCPTQAVYERAGFKHIRSSLRMVIDLDGPPTPPAWPDGIELRPFVPGRDDEETIRAVRDSFSDHWGYVSYPFESELEHFRWRIKNTPYFDPSLFLLAWDGDQIAGISLCYSYFDEDPKMGWVQTLGVRRPWRKRGLGMALLKQSYVELYRCGKQRVGLGVDAESLTGATRLYQKAGMRSDPRSEFKLYEKELRAGVDITTQAIQE